MRTMPSPDSARPPGSEPTESPCHPHFPGGRVGIAWVDQPSKFPVGRIRHPRVGAPEGPAGWCPPCQQRVNCRWWPELGHQRSADVIQALRHCPLLSPSTSFMTVWDAAVEKFCSCNSRRVRANAHALFDHWPLLPVGQHRPRLAKYRGAVPLHLDQSCRSEGTLPLARRVNATRNSSSRAPWGGSPKVWYHPYLGVSTSCRYA